jgi:hypothetical protein
MLEQECEVLLLLFELVTLEQLDGLVADHALKALDKVHWHSDYGSTKPWVFF